MNISKLGKYFDLPFGYISLVLPISVLILEMSIITTDNLRLKTKVRFGLFQKGLEGIIVISKKNVIIDTNDKALEFLKHHSIQLNENGLNSILSITRQNIRSQ